MSPLNFTPNDIMAACRRHFQTGRLVKHLVCMFVSWRKWRRRGAWLDRLDDHARADIGLDTRIYLALKSQIQYSRQQTRDRQITPARE